VQVRSSSPQPVRSTSVDRPSAAATGAAPTSEPTPARDAQRATAQSAAAERAPADSATSEAARQRLLTDATAGQLQRRLQQGVDAARDVTQALDDPRVRDAYNQALDAGIDQVTRSWRPEERAALKRTVDTLDELAGGDGKLNHGDKLAIVGAMTGDTRGLLKEAFSEIDRRLGHRPMINRIAKNVVARSFEDTRRFRRTGRAGPIQRMRMNRREKIRSAAASAINGQLDQTFRQLGVDPRTASKIDGTGRALTFDRMRTLERDIDVLKGRLQGAEGSGRLAEIGRAAAARLGDLVDVSAPPLRNGVPSPRDPRALVDTALDVADSLELKR
jgi:hypothetical protein